jgi:D-alanyl-D-alanine carboxypeptidase/D-alanyl-D-alanine carboxypeptidase (penicillin-binding protein 5/6)
MPLTEVDNASYVTLPDGVAFEQLDSEITYNNTAEGAFASISYSYKGQKLGAADIKYSDSLDDTSDFSKDYKGPKVINIKTVLFRIVEISALMLVLISVLERRRKIYLEKKRLAKIRKSRSSSNRGGFSKRRRPVHHRHKKW